VVTVAKGTDCLTVIRMDGITADKPAARRSLVPEVELHNLAVVRQRMVLEVGPISLVQGPIGQGRQGSPYSKFEKRNTIVQASVTSALSVEAAEAEATEAVAMAAEVTQEVVTRPLTQPPNTLLLPYTRRPVLKEAEVEAATTAEVVITSRPATVIVTAGVVGAGAAGGGTATGGRTTTA
jgi:hypothetical protein